MNTKNGRKRRLKIMKEGNDFDEKLENKEKLKLFDENMKEIKMGDLKIKKYWKEGKWLKQRCWVR